MLLCEFSQCHNTIIELSYFVVFFQVLEVGDVKATRIYKRLPAPPAPQ